MVHRVAVTNARRSQEGRRAGSIAEAFSCHASGIILAMARRSERPVSARSPSTSSKMAESPPRTAARHRPQSSS